MRTSNRSDIVAGAILIGTLAGIALIACSIPESAVSAENDSDGSSILAVVGTEPITKDEVENQVAAEMVRIEQERYQLLKQGLDQVVTDRLLALEAEKRGISVDELLAQEIDTNLTEPTDEEVDAFYEQRKAQIRQPKDEVADRIRQYLQQAERSELQSALVAELKEKHGFQLLLQPIRTPVAVEGFPAKGPADAPVTIVEFSDFECPYCARVNPTLDQIMKAYDGKVRLVFRQFPLNIHPHAQKAAEAALCAHDQGKFWEMHDLMFSEQRSLQVDELKEKATRLELDSQAFDECLDSDRHAEAVSADVRAGSEAGVSGTPALFINGRFLSGAQPFDNLAEVIDEELSMPKAES